MHTMFAILFLVSLMGGLSACNKGFHHDGHHDGHHDHHHGWGHPPPFLLFPKPTLIPKLKHAFIEGKHMVDYYKIVAPSLKPLPYSKGKGKWFAHGWDGVPGVGLYNHIGHHHDFGYGKHGFIGDKGGWAKKVIIKKPIGPHFGHHFEGHHFDGHHGGHHLGGHHGGHHDHGHFIAPHATHHVSHSTVTVVDKGAPHLAQPLVPHDPQEFHGKV